MKTHPNCLACLLDQALKVARISHCSEERQLKVLQSVARLIAVMDPLKSPPENAAPIYQKIAEISGCDDPYYRQKKEANRQALAVVPALRQEIRGADQELYFAVRFAIAGNVIDYGTSEIFNIETALERSRTEKLAVDHFAELADSLFRLAKGSRILYLTDNCGEIVYDSLLIDYLYRKGFDIIIAVKDGPIINDALLEDALEAGLDRFGRIISNGARFPGTILEHCSEQFRDYFHTADLVIAKGQGNFESLSEVKREIFFLLTLKCHVAAEHMAQLSGVDRKALKGKGEMAVYHSRTP